MQVPVALLGDDTGDEPFVGVVVEDNGIRHVFGIALLEEGAAVHFARRVGDRPGAENLAVEVYLYVVGLQLHTIVFDDTFGVELGFAFVDVDGY